jgi:adenine-specific DNA-methyltransferase
MSKKKNNGEVFTPQNIIDYMLNLTYKPKTMDYVLEPGCGDGRFIISILKKLIDYYNEDYNNINLKVSKIYGFELDENNISKTKENIENFLKPYEKITERPKILHCDALLNEVIKTVKFSYIIGNPPYIRIHNLRDDYKEILKKEYEFLRNGMVDLYYGFFELYKKCLKEDGVLCYITPNSFLYNISADNMVQTFYKDKVIDSILDFKSEKMFKNAATYTCITTLKNNSKNIKYFKLDKDFNHQDEIIIEYGKPNLNFLSEVQLNKAGDKFSNLFKIKTGVATLADKIFIIDKFEVIDGLINFTKNNKKYSIEESITKKCAKASKFDENYHRIIFPYKKVDGKNIPLSEEELSSNFPLAYFYLNNNKEKLLLRDKGKIEKNKWFLWGRTQGINNTDGKKILISPLYINSPFVYVEDNVIVYSGYYILCEEYPKLFKSELFINSLKKISKSVANGWFSLQKKILDNVLVDDELSY